jgi:HK97 family phage prohead protease/HK97 family phage major capsid protein
MPMKPHKGESQDDFMGRCVPEMMGDGKREQDQAVAACMQIWRDSKKEHKNFADPGYQSDGIKRFPLDTADLIRLAWHELHHADLAQTYTPEQLRRVKARVTLAWKDIMDKAGPPEDIAGLLALRGSVMLIKKQECPEPEDDESHDDYVERCVEELGGDADEAEEACEMAWDDSMGERGVGAIMHKTHATKASGMEFVLSDATPDRFGDVIEPAGWDTTNFQKNPIALFNHNSSFPIGKWKDIKVDSATLRGTLVLAPKGTSDRIDEIRKLIEADILRAVSVGFRPVKAEPISKDSMGMRYLQHELVETSLVAVPANPNALAVAKSLNISPTTVRMVFGEHADMDTVRRQFPASRGEVADKRGNRQVVKTGEHADTSKTGEGKGKPMLLSKRIQDAEKGLLALQDQLDKHLDTMDDENPSEEQMVITEDLTAKLETKQRHLNSLKAIETKNAGTAKEVTTLAKEADSGDKIPREFQVFMRNHKKTTDPIDYWIRAAVVRCKSKQDGLTVDDMRKKIYGEDEPTRAICDLVLKAASAPAMTTVTGWAAELVQQIYTDFMQVLLPMSVFPKLSAKGLALTFGRAGRIIIPTRNLTPTISGSFVGEGAPIPVRQGSFASQVMTPKKMAVITTWTREMDEHSIPAIEGLLRQAILEDTAISLDGILLDNNVATVIRPPGLRSYNAIVPPAAGTDHFQNLIADIKALYGALNTATKGNVRAPVWILNPAEVLSLRLQQPAGAITTLFPFAAEINAGMLAGIPFIESSTQPQGQVILVDAADFVTAGAEGPRLEISDQATLHMEDTTPQDITGGTPSPATPVKSMWQTDSLALRLVMRMNWLLRRPIVAWTTGVAW